MIGQPANHGRVPKQKRHHLVPRFYLERFGNPKKQVTVYVRRARRSYVTSILTTAVEAGFYEVRDESGEQSEMVEDALENIEGVAKSVIEDIAEGFLPANEAERATLTVFLSLQVTRTRELRATSQVIREFLDRWACGRAHPAAAVPWLKRGPAACR